MLDLRHEKLVIASHNGGKVQEIEALLAPFIQNFTSASELDLEEPEETGSTFVENAILKAKAACDACGLICLADDSGLAVNALHGDPGIYSARWGGPERDFNVAMQKVHDSLGEAEDRSAYFICVLALAFPDGSVSTYEGRSNGHLVWPPRGDKGFGYDPMFVPDGFDKTFAELESQEKYQISHRTRAFHKLQADLLQISA